MPNLLISQALMSQKSLSNNNLSSSFPGLKESTLVQH